MWLTSSSASHVGFSVVQLGQHLTVVVNDLVHPLPVDHGLGSHLAPANACVLFMSVMEERLWSEVGVTVLVP